MNTRPWAFIRKDETWLGAWGFFYNRTIFGIETPRGGFLGWTR